MDIANSYAARAYTSNSTTTSPEKTSGNNALADATKTFKDVLVLGEHTAQQSLAGNADPHALVEALAQSQLAVETAVAVRDKVVEAYQEILRMPV